MVTYTRGDHVRHRRFGGVALWFIGYHTEQPSTAIVRMVGDDRDHEVAADELEPINDDEFCGGCGQIGCSWG